MSLENAHAHQAIDWKISKEHLEEVTVGAAEKAASMWFTSHPGNVFVKEDIGEGVTLQLRRSGRGRSLLFHIFLEHSEKPSAQLELRMDGENQWNIFDRQVRDDLQKGKGIMKAFVRGAESFVAYIASKEKETYRIVLGVSQPQVFQVFEHFGYKAAKEDEDKARILRRPEDFEETVTVCYAWTEAFPSNNLIEKRDMDPYCFPKEVLADNPHPHQKDAIRVTLEKYIGPQEEAVDHISDDVRTEANKLF